MTYIPIQNYLYLPTLKIKHVTFPKNCALDIHLHFYLHLYCFLKFFTIKWMDNMETYLFIKKKKILWFSELLEILVLCTYCACPVKYGDASISEYCQGYI